MLLGGGWLGGITHMTRAIVLVGRERGCGESLGAWKVFLELLVGSSSQPLPSAFTCWLSTCRLFHPWHPAQTLPHLGLPKCSVEL